MAGESHSDAPRRRDDSPDGDASRERVTVASAADGLSLATVDPPSGPLTVLYVDGETEAADDPLSRLEDTGGIDLRSRSTRPRALAALRDADCVVGLPVDDGDALGLWNAVRERTPALPFVLVAAEADEADIAAIRDDEWSDWVPAAAAPATLVDRIGRLVGHRRDAAVARRALATVELAPEGTAIAAPDGTVRFADQSFARSFGEDPDALVGREWRDLFTDAEVKRLESDAIPCLDDGWHWVGACEARGDDGATFTVRTRIAELDDGSLVFILQDGTHTADD